MDLHSALTASLAHSLFSIQIPLGEKILRSFGVFVFLVVALRLGGKRELGQLNMLDMAVLLLVSNALQNALIGPDNSLVGGFVGATVLFGSNYLFVRLTYRSRRASRILEGKPRVLVEDGRLQRRSMEREAISEAELRSVVQERGLSGLEAVERVVLEPNGHLVILQKG
jgi:uncharacterized membrane protein YcaP (DUF421 family)